MTRLFAALVLLLPAVAAAQSDEPAPTMADLLAQGYEIKAYVEEPDALGRIEVYILQSKGSAYRCVYSPAHKETTCEARS